MSNSQFACAKIKMIQSKSIQKTDIDRLLDASSYKDAKQVLVDLSIIPTVNDDYELYLEKIFDKACSNLSRYCNDQNLKNALLIPYVAHNLKMLFKARILGIEADYLYNVGIFKLEDLKRYVLNHNYKALPKQLRLAMEELEKLIIKDFEVYLIDTTIDKACYNYIFELINKVHDPLLIEYFNNKVVFSNTITVQRLKRMGKTPEMIKDVLLESNLISKELFIKSYNAPIKLYNQLRSINKDFAVEYMRFINHHISLSDLEKTADNVLISTFKSTEYMQIDINNFILYLLKLQRSLLAIRLIMSIKASGQSDDEIRERLRDTYAR